jgi:hypothetical protein
MLMAEPSPPRGRRHSANGLKTRRGHATARLCRPEQSGIPLAERRAAQAGLPGRRPVFYKLRRRRYSQAIDDVHRSRMSRVLRVTTAEPTTPPLLRIRRLAGHGFATEGREHLAGVVAG